MACHRWEAAAAAPPPPPPLPPPPPPPKAEQIRTNTFFVLQLKNVRQNVVCDEGFSLVGKPFTTVLVPPSILSIQYSVIVHPR